MTPDVVATYAAASAFVIVSALTLKTRVGPVLITMGTEDDKELRVAVKRAMLNQNRVAFWMVVVSGAIAAIVLFVALILFMFGSSAELMPRIIQVICGLGNSALFRYFYKVWKESGQVLMKM